MKHRHIAQEFNADIVRHPAAISREQREHEQGHRGGVVWLTGLPGSGKSTIAYALECRLNEDGIQTVVLDGDALRLGLCSDLGFSLEERNENVRRAAETAKLFLERGLVVVVSLVSPLLEGRERARQIVPAGDFVEVYCSCSLPVCQHRDPKGHYARAKQGGIAQFTGVSSPYEPPLAAEVVLDTENGSVEACVDHLTRLVTERIRC